MLTQIQYYTTTRRIRKTSTSGLQEWCFSNRCSIIALVSLYPPCYPWRNCYFGRKCCVVEIWFCADWQSVVMPVSSLAAKFHLEPHDVVRSSITCKPIVHAAFVRIKLMMMMTMMMMMMMMIQNVWVKSELNKTETRFCYGGSASKS